MALFKNAALLFPNASAIVAQRSLENLKLENIMQNVRLCCGLWLFGLLFLGQQIFATPECQEEPWMVGAARSDITGPFIGGSTGYNSPGSQMQGLTMRLYSRSFIVSQDCGEGSNSTQSLVFVVNDMLHMHGSIKRGVVEKLKARGYGDHYNDRNIMMMATHTHAAPSNVSWYFLYNAFNGVQGFDELHWQILTDQITQSIISADANLQPGFVRYADTLVEGAAYNRSSIAYDRNWDRNQYESNVDRRMRSLIFETLDRTPIASINWFATHGTSHSQDNALVHGDNKGLASYMVEAAMPAGFVAGFPQGAMGDVSPNRPNPDDITDAFQRPMDRDPALTEHDNPMEVARIQTNAALELLSRDDLPLQGRLASYLKRVDFNHIDVDPEYIGPEAQPYDDVAKAHTCIGVVGGGFLAGDEEGAPVDFAPEGVIRNHFKKQDGGWVMEKYDLKQLEGIKKLLGVLWPLAEWVLHTDRYDACQKEKFNLLPVGDVQDFFFPNPDVPFVPHILPLQMFTLGSVAITSAPFEVTTMLGRRIAKQLQQTLRPSGIDHLIFSGMANAYGHYITTREEFAAQHYEGAFSYYGPWSGNALIQELDRIAQHAIQQKELDPGPLEPDLRDQQYIETWISQWGVVHDGGKFGELQQPAETTYSHDRDLVEVRFRGAHPRTVLSLKLEGKLGAFYGPESYSFLDVQRWDGSEWQNLLSDQDASTVFLWERQGGASSLSSRSTVTIRWHIRDQIPGTYRIRYHGLAKQNRGLWVNYKPFTGISNSFELR